ncbi:MAG: thioredoxin domain-containing protein [Acidobacteria bacterium]|nr:thioredoxin domain-containing protein [Acidobacteriota bacterium]
MPDRDLASAAGAHLATIYPQKKEFVAVGEWISAYWIFKSSKAESEDLMKKFFYTLIIAAFVYGVPADAQTRGRAGSTTAKPAPSRTGAATPAAKPSPTPVQTPASGSQAATPASNVAAGKNEDCGCEDKPLPDVLAVVNGVKITKQDISAETQQRITQLKQQVVDARKHELDLQINSILLEAEAKKRGVSTSKLLEAEVIAKTKEPTEAEAQAFYDQNKTRIQGEFKDVRERIVAYLRDQQQAAQAKSLADRLRAAAQVKILTQSVTPPANDSERARVFAVVNGRNITSGDIEDSLRPLVFSVQEQIYALRSRDVQLKINDILLESEAQKRSVTTRAILDAEITAKVPAVTEAEAQTFYNQNKERVNGDFAQVKEQIMQYLKDQAGQKTESEFAARLRQGAAIQTFIVAPESPVFNIATDDQPAKGNPGATVTVVEFTDFQCPSCAQEHPILERLMNEYGDRVRFVVRDFPLNQHANAPKAAEAAEAAREQGKYWEYVSLLFRNQSALDVSNLKQYASTLGLDRAKFDAALDSGKFADKVQRDMLDGQKLGVNGTPTLYINGKRVSDRSYEGLKTALDAALKAPPRAKASAKN